MVDRDKRVALITGGCSGIGFSIARKISMEGIETVIADVQPPRETIPGNVHYIYCDVCKGSDIDDLYRQLNEGIGLPEILVCNAGRNIHEKLTEGDPEKWQKAFDTNVMGALRSIRAFVPEMLKNKNGDVVFITSVSVNQPYAYGGVYAATKTALEVIAETLRIETHPELRIVVVAPGAVETEFFKNAISGYRSLDEMDFKPLNPDEIAESVWFAINKPKEISINKIILRPTPQIF